MTVRSLDGAVGDREQPDGQRVDGLERATVAGLGWTVGARLAQHLLALAGVAVLARLLTPAEFGLVAMAAVFTGFVAVFADLGLSAALVERREVSERHLSTAFWLSTGMGLLLALALVAAAPVVAAIYDEPELTTIVIALGVGPLLAGLGAVPLGLAQRRMDFRRIAVVETVAAAISFAAAATAAAVGAGVWSLVLLSLVQTSVRSAALWWSSGWRPHLAFARPESRELMRFGNSLAAFNVVNYWTRNADNFLIGRFAGAAQLGLYTRAYSLMLMPVTLVTWGAGRVMFPALARIRADQRLARSAYLRAVSLIAFVTFPLTTIVFVLAEPLVLVLVGPDWTGAIPLVRILCFVGALQSITATSGWILQAYGRTDWMFRWSLANAAVTLSAFAIGIQWGAIGVATAYALRSLLVAPFALVAPGRLIGCRLRDISSPVAASALACLPVGLAVAAVEYLAIGPALVRLVLGSFVGLLVYLATAVAARMKAYAQLRELISLYATRLPRSAAG